jgi:hypothetical protein
MFSAIAVGTIAGSFDFDKALTGFVDRLSLARSQGRRR